VDLPAFSHFKENKSRQFARYMIFLSRCATTQPLLTFYESVNFYFIYITFATNKGIGPNSHETSEFSSRPLKQNNAVAPNVARLAASSL
jgi:hypothetical protein